MFKFSIRVFQKYVWKSYIEHVCFPKYVLLNHGTQTYTWLHPKIKFILKTKFG